MDRYEARDEMLDDLFVDEVDSDTTGRRNTVASEAQSVRTCVSVCVPRGRVTVVKPQGSTVPS